MENSSKFVTLKSVFFCVYLCPKKSQVPLEALLCNILLWATSYELLSLKQNSGKMTSMRIWNGCSYRVSEIIDKIRDGHVIFWKTLWTAKCRCPDIRDSIRAMGCDKCLGAHHPKYRDTALVGRSRAWRPFQHLKGLPVFVENRFWQV
jgi:hypothetical protein